MTTMSRQVIIDAENARLAELHAQDLATERRSLDAVVALSAELAEEAWPACLIGDGNCGWIIAQVIAALAEAGHYTRAGQTPARTPNRRWISNVKRTRIYERDEYRCRTCGTWKGLTVDHVIPTSRGGSDEDDNLQTLCGPCNSRKGNR